MSYGGRFEAFFTVPASTSISVTNNGGGPTTVTLTAGTYTITSLCAHLQSALTSQRAPSSGAWSVSVSTGPSGTGKVTIAMSAGTFSIAWTSTNLRDLLGFTANVSSVASATGTTSARGLWLPKCPLHFSGSDPLRAPRVTDLRGVIGPTGKTTAYVGSSMYRHRGLRYSHVLRERCYEGSASTAYSTWQAWLDDTQFGAGHPWFAPGSTFQIYWQDSTGADVLVGRDLHSNTGPAHGWAFDPPIVECAPRPAADGLLAYWTIEIAGIVSEG